MSTFDWSSVEVRIEKPPNASKSQWVVEMHHQRWRSRVPWEAADAATRRNFPQLHRLLEVGYMLLEVERRELGSEERDAIQLILNIIEPPICASMTGLSGSTSYSSGDYITINRLLVRNYNKLVTRDEKPLPPRQRSGYRTHPWLPQGQYLSLGYLATRIPWLTWPRPRYPTSPKATELDSRADSEAYMHALLCAHEKLATAAVLPTGIYPDLTPELDLSTRCGGHGASSVVYLAAWNSGKGETEVAVKLFRVANQADSNNAEKISNCIKRELDTWSDLKNPHILPLLGMHWIDGIPGLVSPWCRNGDISRYLSNLRGPAKIAIAVELLEQVASGLVYLHRRGIVHGDLKAANIVISDDERALLCDFGLTAVVASVVKTSVVNMPGTSAKGTYRWMARELFVDDDPKLTRETDVWAFGCVLVEVLGGRVPFHEKLGQKEVITAISLGHIPSRPPGLHDRAWALILRCWQVDPSDRPPASDVLWQICALPPAEEWAVIEETDSLADSRTHVDPPNQVVSARPQRMDQSLVPQAWVSSRSSGRDAARHPLLKTFIVLLLFSLEHSLVDIDLWTAFNSIVPWFW